MIHDRQKKVEMHFRLSVVAKVHELLTILEPGGKQEWGSMKYKELTSHAGRVLHAESNEFEQVGGPTDEEALPLV